MIPSTRAAERRKHSALPDFLRRTPRLVVIVTRLSILLVLAPVADAAEVRTYYVRCGGVDPVIAQLEPAGTTHTRLLDVRSSPPVAADTFAFPSNTDNIATRIDDVRTALVRQGMTPCASAIRIVSYGREVVYPRLPNVSPAVDSAEARRQQHWTHADARLLQERGQGDVITASDALHTDPGWPLYAVGMVLFFSAGNGGDTDIAVIYAWNHVTNQYDRVGEATDITPWSQGPDIQTRLLAHVEQNLVVPALIPAADSSPELAVVLNREKFTRALNLPSAACVSSLRSSAEIASCVDQGNAVFLSSSFAHSWDPDVPDRVVGAVLFSGSQYGQIVRYSAVDSRYVTVPDLPNLRSALCRRCLKQPETQRLLRDAVLPNLVASNPVTDTSLTVGDVTTAPRSSTAPAVESGQATTAPDAVTRTTQWVPPWLKIALAVTACVVAIALAAGTVLFVLGHVNVVRLRRRHASIRADNRYLEEMLANLNDDLRDVRVHHASARALNDQEKEETARAISTGS